MEFIFIKETEGGVDVYKARYFVDDNEIPVPFIAQTN